MKLYIAEKPSLARAINSYFASSSNKQGYFETNTGDCITWCFGHLLESYMPEEYDARYKVWDMKNLPIILTDWKLKPRGDASVKAQLKIIEGLLKRATVVVNAGDPDREGQLLVDEILNYYNWKGKTERLLLNAVDKSSVTKAMQSLKPNSQFANVSEAALCRSKADWLVGMNLSRAAQLTHKRNEGGVISIGRVQTPTLALVVKRDLEILNFVSRDFYTLTAHVNSKEGKLEMEHNNPNNRIFDKKIADAIQKALVGQDVKLINTKESAKELAPLPYMWASFQKDAEQEFGYNAKKALEVLQKLYDDQLTTYPRSDCEYLPKDQAADALKIAQALIGFGVANEAKPLMKLLAPSPRVYDSSKVGEHHGIIPTGKLPTGLAPDLMNVYRLIARRFIASLLPNYEFEKTTITFIHDKKAFNTSGEVPLNMGNSWRALFPKKTTGLTLSGEPKSGKIDKLDVKKGKTTPPQPYTEASLVAAMRSVHELVSDPALKEKLKESKGIGTAATQAGIIDHLKYRKMIESSGKGKVKKINSTEFGKYVISVTPDSVKDPVNTALWEQALSLIQEGKMKPSDFIDRINAFVVNQINLIKA